MSTTCMEDAMEMPRKCKENAKEMSSNAWKCNNKQHRHPVPPKHEEGALKCMES